MGYSNCYDVEMESRRGVVGVAAVGMPCSTAGWWGGVVWLRVGHQSKPVRPGGGTSGRVPLVTTLPRRVDRAAQVSGRWWSWSRICRGGTRPRVMHTGCFRTVLLLDRDARAAVPPVLEPGVGDLVAVLEGACSTADQPPRLSPHASRPVSRPTSQRCAPTRPASGRRARI